MSRPLRIEFPGAVYHVTARGDRREPIYRDDADRLAQLAVMAVALDRFEAQLLAYCLMGNHYHLVLHTRQANLFRLMRHINGVYTQTFNRRHRLVGRLFQGRFKAILVDRDRYLLALCRYVERNPVAAKLVPAAGDWRWSSYRAHIGLETAPPWLDGDALHGYLLGRAIKEDGDRRRARRRYAALVADADTDTDATSIWQQGLRQQVFLGDEAFVARMQGMATREQRACVEVPKTQRKQRRPLQAYLDTHSGDRSRALRAAFRKGGMTMSGLTGELNL